MRSKEDAEEITNPFRAIEFEEGLIYLNPLAIAYFEEDPELGGTKVVLVTGEHFRFDGHVKAFWDQFDER